MKEEKGGGENMARKTKTSRVKTTSKRKSTGYSRSYSHHEQNSFLIIVGGGFVIIAMIFLLMNGGRTAYDKVSAKSSPTVEESRRNTTNTVTMKNLEFDKKILNIKVGDIVTWVNEDTVSHTATADDGSFNTQLLAQGEKASITFTKKGTYTYHCTVHPSMRGTIVVEE